MRRGLSESHRAPPTPWSPFVEPRDDLVEPVRVDAGRSAAPTKRQASGPHWRQSSPGLYVPAHVECHVEQRILEQARRIQRWGAVTGWAALRWRGAAYFDGTAPDGSPLPVPLVVGHQSLRADSRISISESQLAPGEWMHTRGIRIASVQRAVFDTLRFEPSLRAAVVAMDMVAAARLTSVSLMSTYVRRRPAWTGVPHVRRVLALASDESASPQETRMRLAWMLDAGLSEPLCNRPVFSSDGRLLGIPDLFDPETGTAGEYEGGHHIGQRREDLIRESRFRDHGIEPFTVVAGDFRERYRLVQRMHATRNRAAQRAAPRSWTLTPPAGWVPRVEPLDVHLVRTGQAPDLVRCDPYEASDRFAECIYPAYSPTEGP